jgi:hypothetical protein
MNAQVLLCRKLYDSVRCLESEHVGTVTIENIRIGRGLNTSCIVRLHGKLCDRCLNEHWLVILHFVLVKTESGRRTNNKDPPCSSNTRKPSLKVTGS